MLGWRGGDGNGRLQPKLVEIEQKHGSEIPSYALYGEAAFPDVLHIETIAARSRPQGWLIKPHRHRELHQFLWIAAGSVVSRADGAEMALAAPAAIMTVPGEVHGFAFAPDTLGYVLSVPTIGLAQGALVFGGLDRLRRPLALSGAALAGAEGLPALFAALDAEYRRDDAHRAAALLGLAALVALAFMRCAAGRPAAAGLVRRFRDLVEAEFFRARPLSFYARALGVTSAHLSRACRGALGRSALAVLHERVAVEAKRKLAYTPATIGAIAEDLGFVDPSHFTKFFKARTGTTPRAFRARLGN